jgi:hypothetical protein
MQSEEPNWPLVGEMGYYNYWYSRDVYDIIYDIYNSYDRNLGFMLKDANETSTTIWDKLYSSDCGDSTKVPVLTIGYSWIQGYVVLPGEWTDGYSENLTVHIDTSTVLSTYQNEIQTAAYLWNGINTNVHISSVNMSSGNPDGYRIRVVGTANLVAGRLAQTENYSYTPLGYVANTHGEFPGYPWVYSLIEIPTETTRDPYSWHNDLQVEVFAHEIGHSLGLDDIDGTTALMQQYICYYYPMVCSHDKNALNSKYP